MHYLFGNVAITGKLCWDYNERTLDGKEGLQINFNASKFSHSQGKQAIEFIEKVIKDNELDWITPDGKVWVLDLDNICRDIPELSQIPWFTRKAYVEPDFMGEEVIRFGKQKYTAKVFLNVTEDTRKWKMTGLSNIPAEISNSIERFKEDYPEPEKVAFIIMRFGKMKAYDNIVLSIKKELKAHGLIGVRADDKEYHEDLFPNVLTYIYGCGFGIAVYERIEGEVFNPNIALEVGYMMALKKPVCLLKEKTLKILHTDLVGKLYKEFEIFNPEATIPVELQKWLKDKGIIGR